MMRKFFTLLTTLVVLLIVANIGAPQIRAQGFDLNLGGLGAPGPTTTTRAVASVDPFVSGKEGLIAVELSVKSGWHVQSATTEKPYIPLQLTVAPAPGLDFGP